MAGASGKYVRTVERRGAEAECHGGAVMRALLLLLLFSFSLMAQIFPGRSGTGTGNVTIKDGETVVGSRATVKFIEGAGIITAMSDTGSEISIQIDSTATGTARQGMWFGSQESNTTNLAQSAADRIVVQAVYVTVPWEVRRLIMNVNAADTLASQCLYSWGGPSVTTATLVASTAPASIATGYDDRAISQTSVTIQPGWYLYGFTGHAGTFGIKRGANTVMYTPVAAQEIATGVTDGSCPASLSGITTSFTTTYPWRFGWRY
jgi:hypothetical protein